MTRGQLPKAYLRVDPNIDQTHPDNLEGFVRLLCAANRQPARGRFRNRATLDALFGKTATDRLYQRGDVRDTDGLVEVVGWSAWQEGDLTVAERVRRIRSKDVTDPLHERYTAVTSPLPGRYPASEASMRLGVKALDVLSDERRAPEETEALQEAIAYIEARSRRPWGFGVGSKPWETLTADVRDFGWPKVRDAMEALTSPFPDVGQLVFGASRRLHPVETAPNGQAEPDPEYVKAALAERRKARSHA